MVAFQVNCYMKLEIVLLLLLFSTCSYGQVSRICEGNLGENIFENGDFGEGSANLVAMDPGIAPGYKSVSRFSFR